MASKLQAFAKKRKKEETTVITARIPNSKYNAFKKYCDDLGLSINEAINILINDELKEASKVNNEIIQDVIDDVNQVTIDDVINSESEVSATVNNEVMADDEKEVNTKVNTKVNASRFTYDSFEIDKQIPCPICNEWFDKSNFARHTKNKHKQSPQQILLNDEYKEQLNNMIESRKPSS
jgi:antitoxin component of RelBE/YafQ-DinJ toxin-antitoxin module